MLGDGGATAMWSNVEGLRHKYFVYDEKTNVCCGVYMFYSEDSLNKYMASDLFKMHNPEAMPHFSKVEFKVLDVMPGTELSIEKTAWKNTPPTRDDVIAVKMLIVDITLDFTTGVEGLPTNSEEFYGFIGTSGYPGMFGGLEGLRGKYFVWNEKSGHCFGFYTFVSSEGLDKYMSSELFTKQGEPPTSRS